MLASFMTFPEHGITVSVTSNTSDADTYGLAVKIAQAFAARRAAGSSGSRPRATLGHNEHDDSRSSRRQDLGYHAQPSDVVTIVVFVSVVNLRDH